MRRAQRLVWIGQCDAFEIMTSRREQERRLTSPRRIGQRDALEITTTIGHAQIWQRNAFEITTDRRDVAFELWQRDAFEITTRAETGGPRQPL